MRTGRGQGAGGQGRAMVPCPKTHVPTIVTVRCGRVSSGSWFFYAIGAASLDRRLPTRDPLTGYGTSRLAYLWMGTQMGRLIRSRFWR
jgi:hypothetical protein